MGLKKGPINILHDCFKINEETKTVNTIAFKYSLIVLQTLQIGQCWEQGTNKRTTNIMNSQVLMNKDCSRTIMFAHTCNIVKVPT